MKYDKTPLEKILDSNLSRYVDLDYGYETNCEDSGCHEEGICRCGRIVDVTIEKVRSASIFSIFKPITKDTLIDGYCIDRILHCNCIWDTKPEEVWEINICGGYYGEEIDSVKFNFFIKEKLTEQIKDFLSLESKADKIKNVLSLEYDYLLNSIENLKEANIVRVFRKDIQIGQKDHYEKLNKYAVNSYKEMYTENKVPPIPICVCTRSNGEYKLIDGYHRLSACNAEEIDIIVLE